MDATVLMFHHRLKIWGCIGAALLCALIGVFGYRAWARARTEAFHSACKQAADAQDWGAVEREATQWAAWDRRNAMALVFLAQAAEQNQHPELAAAYLDRVRDDDPACVRALLVRVDLLFKRLNHPLEAVRTCQRILKISPENVEARRRLTFFYALTLQRRQMERLIRESIDLACETPEAYVYLVLGGELSFSDGLANTSLWLKRHPDSELFLVPHALYVKQYQDQPLFAEGSFADNQDPIEICSRRFPQNLEVLAYTLQQRSDAGDLAGMAELLSRLPPLAEEDSRFWRYKGQYHLGRHELAEAESALQEGLRLDPYEWQCRHMLAEVFRLTQRSQDAESMARIAASGKQLARELKAFPNPAQISREMLLSIVEHARACQDRQIAERLEARLNPAPQKQTSQVGNDY